MPYQDVFAVQSDKIDLCPNVIGYDEISAQVDIVLRSLRDKNLFQVRLWKSRHANLCSKNQFFRENVVIIAFSELRQGSNERYENSTFYGHGPFRFLIFIFIFDEKNFFFKILSSQNAITTTFSRKN